MEPKRSELKAGLFLNLILALLLVSIMLLSGHRRPLQGHLNYHFRTANAQGLIPGAKVLIAGVHAGRVRSLRIDPLTREVDVSFEIDPEYKGIVRSDSVVEVTTEGVLGDKYVLVSLGKAESPPAPRGAELASQPGKGIDQLIGQGDVLLKSMNRVVEHLEQIISRPEDRNNLSELIANLKDISHKLNTGLQEAALQDSINKLNQILAKIDSGTGTVGALINDPSVYDDLKSLVGEVNRNRIMRNLVRKNIEDSEKPAS